SQRWYFQPLRYSILQGTHELRDNLFFEVSDYIRGGLNRLSYVLGVEVFMYLFDFNILFVGNRQCLARK
ncbi:MAG: hypothetical protein KJZ66_13825, partial [Candidatus Kuenenia stuttgartiensis]|nr:hypothetical protein [Candidatus Kuenenia stuttgartiensis]